MRDRKRDSPLSASISRSENQIQESVCDARPVMLAKRHGETLFKVGIGQTRMRIQSRRHLQSRKKKNFRCGGNFDQLWSRSRMTAADWSCDAACVETFAKRERFFSCLAGFPRFSRTVARHVRHRWGLPHDATASRGQIATEWTPESRFVSQDLRYGLCGA
jgi:hypothetical protein